MLHPPTKKRRVQQQQRALSSFSNYLRTITTSRIGVFHHTDPDGIASGILLQKLITAITRKKPKLYPTTYDSLHKKQPFNIITTKKLDHALFVDLAIDEQLPFIKKLEQLTNWFLIDHHELYNDHENILKPQKFTIIPSGKYPCAKLVYDLLPKKAQRGNDWIACLGIIGDQAMTQWEHFLNTTYKNHSWKKEKNWYDTIIGKACRIITSIEATKDQKLLNNLTQLLSKAKTPEKLIKSPLSTINNVIEQEINTIVKQLSKKIGGPAFYAEIESPYAIKGPVSTLLSLQHPSTTTILAHKEGTAYHISGRRQDGKESVSTILRTAVTGLPGSAAGGHPQAAGATIPEEHYIRFKKKIFTLLKLENDKQ